MELPSKGQIGQVSFIDVLKDAARFELTGMIRVEKGSIIKVVYIQKGHISFASSNEPSDRLTEVLKRAGRLTAEQVVDAQTRMKPQVSLGKTLVELGYISPKDLLWGARAQVDGILHQLVFWNQGTYQVIEGTLPKEIINLNLSVPSVIFDGVIKSQNREWVLQHIGSPEAVYALSPDFREKNAILNLPVDAIAARMNGKRSLHDIADIADMDTFEVCKAVVALEILELARQVKQPLQMTLLVPEEEEPFQIDEISDPGESRELGELLQMPTVEELENSGERPVFEEEEEEEKEKEPVIETPLASALVVSGKAEDPVPEPEKVEAEAAEIDMPVNPTMRLEDFKLAQEEPEEEVKKDPEPVEAREIAEPEPQMERESIPEEQPEIEVEEEEEEEQEEESEEESKGAIPMEGLLSGSRRVQAPKWAAPLVISTIFVVMGLAVGWYYWNYREALDSANPTPPSTVDPLPHTELPKIKKEPKPQPPKIEVVQPPPANNVPPESPLGRLMAGKTMDAAADWQRILTRSKAGYSIQILIACQEKTVQDSCRSLQYSQDIIVLPLKYKGQNCYRLLFGRYTTHKLATVALKNLPQEYLHQASPAAVVLIAKVLGTQ